MQPAVPIVVAWIERIPSASVQAGVTVWRTVRRRNEETCHPHPRECLTTSATYDIVGSQGRDDNMSGRVP